MKKRSRGMLAYSWLSIYFEFETKRTYPERAYDKERWQKKCFLIHSI